MTLVQKEVKKVYIGTHQVRPAVPAVTERPDLNTFSLSQTNTISDFTNQHAITTIRDGNMLYISTTSYLRQYSMSNHDITNLTLENTRNFDSRWLDLSPDWEYLYSIKDGYSSYWSYTTRLQFTTPYDLSTAVETYNLNWNNNYVGCCIKSDLSRIYRWNAWQSSQISYADLTDWAINTTLNWQSYGVGAITVNGRSYNKIYDVKISPTGLKMFVCQHYNNTNYWCIAQYTLSTARDVTTATYDNMYIEVPNNTWRFAFDVDNHGNLYAVEVWANTLYKYTSSN